MQPLHLNDTVSARAFSSCRKSKLYIILLVRCCSAYFLVFVEKQIPFASLVCVHVKPASRAFGPCAPPPPLGPQLGRAQFAHAARAPLAAIANVAAAALADAGLSTGSSSSRGSSNGRAVTVLLVGGGARSAAVVDAVRARVAALVMRGSSADLAVVVPAAPEEAVVLGAALAAKAGWVS